MSMDPSPTMLLEVNALRVVQPYLASLISTGGEVMEALPSPGEHADFGIGHGAEGVHGVVVFRQLLPLQQCTNDVLETGDVHSLSSSSPVAPDLFFPLLFGCRPYHFDVANGLERPPLLPPFWNFHLTAVAAGSVPFLSPFHVFHLLFVRVLSSLVLFLFLVARASAFPLFLSFLVLPSRAVFASPVRVAHVLAFLVPVALFQLLLQLVWQLPGLVQRQMEVSATMANLHSLEVLQKEEVVQQMLDNQEHYVVFGWNKD